MEGVKVIEKLKLLPIKVFANARLNNVTLARCICHQLFELDNE
jgi:hypothetical protein